MASRFFEVSLKIIGIDPGKKGALALADESKVQRMEVMPEFPNTVLDILRSWSPDHVFLEKAQSMPKQNSASTFKYGVHYGELRGLLITLEIPFTCIHPRTWTKSMHKGATVKKTAKEKSKEIAIQIFPHLNFLATERSKVPHDGLIDAALIAEYGRRELVK